MLLTIPQAAALLGKSERQVRRRMRHKVVAAAARGPEALERTLQSYKARVRLGQGVLAYGTSFARGTQVNQEIYGSMLSMLGRAPRAHRKPLSLP